MIELRWLKGKWPEGKFRLQIRYRVSPNTINFSDWTDILVFEDKPKEKSLEEKIKLEIMKNEINTTVEGITSRVVKVVREHYGDKK